VKRTAVALAGALAPAALGQASNDPKDANTVRITSIGGQGAKGADGWNFRVNSLYKAEAARGGDLKVGDRVPSYWGQEFATVLQIAAPATGTVPGAAVDPGIFTVTINEVTAKNKRSPSSGATVTYGTAPATTGANGQATFTAIAGTNALRVTEAARIAATTRVCTRGGGDCPC